MIKIKSKDITPENFLDYGKVVIFPETKPTSQGAHYKFWSDVASYGIEGETEIGICQVFKQVKNNFNGMERHLNTPEILIPIDAPFVLPLIKDKEPDQSVAAFKVNIGQAVIINPAVWHGACIPIGKKESSYFVIFRRGTPAADVHLKDMEEFEILDQ